MPVQRLGALYKLHDIAPGASRPVVLELTPRDFSIWSVQHQRWEQVLGDFGVAVGSSSRDLRLRGSLQLRALRY